MYIHVCIYILQTNIMHTKLDRHFLPLSLLLGGVKGRSQTSCSSFRPCCLCRKKMDATANVATSDFKMVNFNFGRHSMDILVNVGREVGICHEYAHARVHIYTLNAQTLCV